VNNAFEIIQKPQLNKQVIFVIAEPKFVNSRLFRHTAKKIYLRFVIAFSYLQYSNQKPIRFFLSYIIGCFSMSMLLPSLTSTLILHNGIKIRPINSQFHSKYLFTHYNLRMVLYYCLYFKMNVEVNDGSKLTWKITLLHWTKKRPLTNFVYFVTVGVQLIGFVPGRTIPWIK
jgi:hypothetical protein